MDLKQLECFVAVAEERHFTRAARRLNVVQSGLSQTIRSLEQELGGPLFVRSTRHVDLTPAGRVLLEEANRVLAAARDARLAVTQVHDLARGQLRIGSIQSLVPFVDLPELLGRFRDKFPGIDIELQFDGTAPLLDAVAEGRLDLAFTQPGGAKVAVSTRVLACEDMVLVCKPGDPLAGAPSPGLDMLTGRTFVDLQADWGMRRLLDRSFAALGVTRNIAFAVNDVPMLLDLVGHGLGIALVPASVARARERNGGAGSIAVVELADGAPPRWELIVAFKGRAGQPSNRITTAFLDLLVSTAGAVVQFQQ